MSIIEQVCSAIFISNVRIGSSNVYGDTKQNPAEVFGKTHAGQMLDVKMDYFLDSLTLTGSGIF